MKKAFLVLLMGIFSITLYAQNQFPVNYKELPKDIQKYITKNYAGFAIDKAMQAEDAKKNITFYDVYISKDTKKVILTFDKDARFIKEAPIVDTAPPKVEPVKEAPKPADTVKK